LEAFPLLPWKAAAPTIFWTPVDESVHTLSSADWILIQEGTLQYKALHFSSLAQVVRPRHFAIRHMLAAIFHYAS
jgi:hypothetical protein